MNIFFFIILLILFNYFFYKNYQKISSIIRIFDYPDKIRKKHLNPIPLLGGPQLIINIYIIYFANYFLQFIDAEFQFNDFLIFSTLVFLLGFFDDKFDINVTLKFSSLLAIILFLLLLNDKLLIKNLYFETGNYNFYIAKYSIFFTLLCFLLFLNACNMFDGVNLQLVLYSSQILIFFLIQNIFLMFSILILISLLFFILLNKDGKIFFGDSGSLLIGFVIAYIVINQYNINPQKLSCEVIFLIMFLPGVDMFRLFLLRLINKKNPFKPDRNHIHHLIGENYNFLKSTLIIQSTIFVSLLISTQIKIIYVILFLILFYIGLINFFTKLNLKQ